MKVFSHLAKLPILLLAAMVYQAPAAEPELRPALTKSLAFLAREGERWMDEKSCNG